MEKLLKELSEAHPDEGPIKKSKYTPNCVLGKTFVCVCITQGRY